MISGTSTSVANIVLVQNIQIKNHKRTNMQILLTPSQQSTLWNFCNQVKAENGETYFYFPYFLRDDKGGFFERLTLEQLPENIKDQILKAKGL